MSIGLLALLDDVAALVKIGAASLDDIPAQVAKTTGKVAGIVVDDTAVTPKYVVGLDPSRELSIIYRIARKSLVNKIVILGPAALLLGSFLPAVVQPILMLGGAYLCFEGYEKIASLFHTAHDKDPQAADGMEVMTPEELERTRVDSAVRTDLILSAEIMAITYATVVDKPLSMQIIVMLCVAVFITVAVYGFVGCIVKADDLGVHMARKSRFTVGRAVGRGLVTLMPGFLTVLGFVGTGAMLWVGAEIIAHGVPFLHHGLDILHGRLGHWPLLAWLAKTLTCAIGGLVLGGVVEKLVHGMRHLLPRKK